ncbi:hypothetical protein [Methylobacterium oxalidis]|uniref:Uncharacterized protein n=1 Tax=Methylobacterium oxalidis TaxID=944322 RepID=A0A512J9F8_9HYPH|nr:hypothetical protein [Methylobacterium oxalidis]GEP06600.1 hypothetical protein MOX02_46380 [Methylobacterium oxalidis]GJE35415.1 hypothetical protein LDDCCGHA_5633 [Methylobacterium oxalidis]GLS66214.1 hypothetical protein GCM10007888_45960 [Methylobacterium oxalidis]
MSKLAMAAAAFALAAVAFWSVILTSPPTSHAAVAPVAAQADGATADHCVPFSLCP